MENVKWISIEYVGIFKHMSRGKDSYGFKPNEPDRFHEIINNIKSRLINKDKEVLLGGVEIKSLYYKNNYMVNIPIIFRTIEEFDKFLKDYDIK
jgi:hypothetical protein